MSWYKITFSEGELKNNKGTQAKDEFIKLYSIITSRGSVPKHLALFSSSTLSDGGQFFFIHAPSVLETTIKPYLVIYSAVPCERPSSKEAGIEFGVQDDKELLS